MLGKALHYIKRVLFVAEGRVKRKAVIFSYNGVLVNLRKQIRGRYRINSILIRDC